MHIISHRVKKIVSLIPVILPSHISSTPTSFTEHSLSSSNFNIKTRFICLHPPEENIFPVLPLLDFNTSVSLSPPSSLVLFSFPPSSLSLTLDFVCVSVSVCSVSHTSSAFPLPLLSRSVLGGLRQSRGSSIYKPACYLKREDLSEEFICTWHIWVRRGLPNTSHRTRCKLRN